jgi:folate-dependent phosphoribosylglycinamide formyltransferase PurN
MRLFLLASPKIDHYWRDVLEPVFAEPQIEVVGACVDVTKPAPLRTRLRRELKKGRGAYVGVMAAKLVARALTNRDVPTAPYLREKGVDIREVDDLYAETTLDFIRGTRPDCIFRFGFGFIHEPVLSLAPKGVISYHHGNIRSYRGQPVAFWELYAGEREMGVTIQVLREKLDAGKIVLERRIAIRPSDTWKSLERRAYDESRSMIHEACLLLDQDEFRPQEVPDAELGKLYMIPNFRQWVTLQGKVLARRVRR